jgi:hypothetical protein
VLGAQLALQTECKEGCGRGRATLPCCFLRRATALGVRDGGFGQAARLDLLFDQRAASDARLGVYDTSARGSRPRAGFART